VATASAPALEVRSTGSAHNARFNSDGSFRAIVSTPNLDAWGQIILPSAFTHGQEVPLVLNHDWNSLPVGRGKISTGPSVAFHGTFFNAARAQEARETLKALKELAEFSIGYQILNSDEENRGDERVRVVKKLKLFEVSIVLVGATPGTGLVGDVNRKESAAVTEAMQHYRRLEAGLAITLGPLGAPPRRFI
jgi:HK97 family phage prohead protease